MIDEAGVRSPRDARVELGHVAWKYVLEASQAIEQLRRDPTFTGAIRLEVEPTGIRVWLRNKEHKTRSMVSFKVIEQCHFNPITRAIHECLQSDSFDRSHAGASAKRAKKRQA